MTTVGPKMMVGPHLVRERLGPADAVAASFRAPFEIAPVALRNWLRGPEPKEVSGPVAIAGRGSTEFLFVAAAATATLAALVALGLLVVAALMSVLRQRNSVLPTSGNSS